MAPSTFPIRVSSGILEPRHRKNIGSAIWLFLLLIDWTTDEQNGVGHVRGGKPIKVKELMEPLELQERQVREQLQRLKVGEYISLRRTPYGYSIDVLKSKKWVYRDRQFSAALFDSDRQKTPGLAGETGSFSPNRPAENTRCNILDSTESHKKIARRKKCERADTDPRIKILLTAFVDKYLVRVGTPYVVVVGKDPALLKRPLIAGHGVLAIEAAMDRYFADDFYNKNGFDVGGFIKAFNRVNSAGSKKKHNYEEGAFPNYE